MSAPAGLPDQLRQMIAVLEDERQALAALDLDRLTAASNGKLSLCTALERETPATLDDESRGLLETARRLNEVNRRVRNLLAANVSARLEALSGGGGAYRLARAANF